MQRVLGIAFFLFSLQMVFWAFYIPTPQDPTAQTELNTVKYAWPAAVLALILVRLLEDHWRRLVAML